ncbi:transcription/translation regulatory transformer protein RfaH [Modicisalibacter tunisiensis]|uniref:transcription/translation regulatory transformer protein RfaH n=1 Tax=Modicisalibacter TaxID=574347 RepID=UPI000797C060|nr:MULTISPECIES: transcription/translation regulatory transformer protein RfaH [Modicisalibacter]KXS39411.1 MAG: transcriptional antiterminator RfaH [Halomonadaceae bacterium T82-2]MBZ9537945.1 transcription/translation regulatory transformer protein RfaH [Modicisalibacter tunisiensis]
MSESNSVSADIDTRAIPHWYLIQCKGGESFRATENLANQGYEIFHPVLQVQKKRRGRLCWVDEPLFPYYLFIRLDRLASNWRPIRSTRGVLRLVTFGDQPLPVDDALVDALRHNAAATADEREINVYFRAGDVVEICEGPFRQLQAVFERRKGEERAIVLLNLLHGQQAVDLPISQLRRS